MGVYDEPLMHPNNFLQTVLRLLLMKILKIWLSYSYDCEEIAHIGEAYFFQKIRGGHQNPIGHIRAAYFVK